MVLYGSNGSLAKFVLINRCSKCCRKNEGAPKLMFLFPERDRSSVILLHGMIRFPEAFDNHMINWSKTIRVIPLLVGTTYQTEKITQMPQFILK